MGARVPKALMPLGSRPLVVWSLLALTAGTEVDALVLVAPPGHESEMRMAVGESGGSELRIVPGGATRQRSVAAGLLALPEETTRVTVHDAARPLVTPELVAAVLAGIEGVEGAIAASPVADTIKRAGSDMIVTETVDRSDLWRAETPQAFHADVLRHAFANADDRTLDTATDCASMIQALGGRIRLVPSPTPNLKVTTSSDIVLAEAVLRAQARITGA
jgi:2-C-methyl-D-erythritol 4-phosphate cytidylyltransferase